MSNREKQRGFMAMVNDDYEQAKTEACAAGNPQRISVRIIERRWKLPAGRLLYFRANLPRNKTPLPDFIESL